MDNRRRAARPRRAGETFARTHHLDTDDHDASAESSAAKKVKFDVRNPSALAYAEREEEDAFLDADVIGRPSGTTKRGAVNIEGFESDSDVDEFNAKAQRRAKKPVDINEKFAKYNPADDGTGKDKDEDEDEDDVNMFAGEDGDEEGGKTKKSDEDDLEFYSSGKKKKDVRFLDASNIQGQNQESKSGGKIRIDSASEGEDESDEDDEPDPDGDAEAWKDEVLDEELGAGGLKKHAPKVEAFNLREELEEGRFDENQNYVRNAVDPDAVHDKWLDGVNKRAIKRAAVAHERREAEAQQLRREEDGILTADLLSTLIRHLERGETALEALARLGRKQNKDSRVPKWKLKKMGAMETDDPEQARISEAITAITDAADKLFSRDNAEIYEKERELLAREYKRETGEEWTEPRADDADGKDGAPPATKMWEYRWIDGRDGAAKQGPFDGPTMKAWQDAGYFGEGVEFRPAGEEGPWDRIARFV
ncbi:uncharacterized protein DNG_08441 [Cephalotrichum gorgonifer]|uniref:GYF domain-containing protein n=1 Tax=Cephalotrichum gorgonifer TaxID=2041049 RepID=A0AAE8N540_9PEZI|nr:uncharacterized protein DNG_08441 [Cephalotrichum gorgonifer]